MFLPGDTTADPSRVNPPPEMPRPPDAPRGYPSEIHLPQAICPEGPLMDGKNELHLVVHNQTKGFSGAMGAKAALLGGHLET